MAASTRSVIGAKQLLRKQIRKALSLMSEQQRKEESDILVKKVSVD